MKKYKNPLLISTLTSIFISLFVFIAGIFLVNKLKNEEEDSIKANKCYFDSNYSKIVMCAMRIQQLEQELDMQRLRIEDLEEIVTNTVSNATVQTK